MYIQCIGFRKCQLINTQDFARSLASAKFGTLSWLTAVRTPTLLFLIPCHARSEGDVHTWRRRKSEAFGHLGQIQLINIKHRPQAV